MVMEVNILDWVNGGSLTEEVTFEMRLSDQVEKKCTRQKNSKCKGPELGMRAWYFQGQKEGRCA